MLNLIELATLLNISINYFIFNINIFHIWLRTFLKNFGLKISKLQRSWKTIECLPLISSSGVTHFNILLHLLYLIIYTHTHTNAHTHTHLPTVRSTCVLQVNFCGVIRQGYINSSIWISTGFSTIFWLKNAVHLIDYLGIFAKNQLATYV